jgi:hypothetical protein
MENCLSTRGDSSIRDQMKEKRYLSLSGGRLLFICGKKGVKIWDSRKNSYSLCKREDGKGKRGTCDIHYSKSWGLT